MRTSTVWSVSFRMAAARPVAGTKDETGGHQQCCDAYGAAGGGVGSMAHCED